MNNHFCSSLLRFSPSTADARAGLEFVDPYDFESFFFVTFDFDFWEGFFVFVVGETVLEFGDVWEVMVSWVKGTLWQ